MSPVYPRIYHRAINALISRKRGQAAETRKLCAKALRALRTIREPIYSCPNGRELAKRELAHMYYVGMPRKRKGR